MHLPKVTTNPSPSLAKIAGIIIGSILLCHTGVDRGPAHIASEKTIGPDDFLDGVPRAVLFLCF